MARILIHQTDLFHSHGDPDDHIDLATVFALALRQRLVLRGIVVDYPPPRRRGDPAIGAVAQLSRLSGVVTPVVVGTSRQMQSRDDTSPADAREDSGAVRFVLDTLRQSDEPVLISVVGSATDIAIAGKLEPELFARKCAGLYLNSGSAMENPDQPGRLEFNVALNPAGYAALFDLPCPLYWCPCWHMTEHHEVGRHGAFWAFVHRDVFSDLRDDLKKVLLYMLDQEPSHRWLTYLRRPLDERNWDFFQGHWRGMWSTASLLHAAGLTVSVGGVIEPVDACLDSLFDFIPVDVTCDGDGRTVWTPATPAGPSRWLLEIRDTGAYSAAMAQALRSLLQEL